MAGLAHLGVGLAAKRIAPNVSAGWLVAAAYGIDIVWAGFWAAGVEHLPAPGVDSTAPWSHGLFMSIIWSLTAAAIAMLISRNRRTSLIIGLLVFSHWVVDFMAKPMLHVYPSDSGVTLFFDKSWTMGLGLWRTAAGVSIGEYGTTAVGLIIYIMTLIALRKPHAKGGSAA
ncbi:MAG: hypothetical protein K0R39_3378 [Symbiobacteriaceae bacterium]|jgi:hypothetical protein|nr:hypothetical protein [Symbiobacteriaceae bacterium]